MDHRESNGNEGEQNHRRDTCLVGESVLQEHAGKHAALVPATVCQLLADSNVRGRRCMCYNNTLSVALYKYVQSR